ncbi:HNH endonuclease signature motif containing protein [Streptomyces sp. Ru87]|uniref:HNH endonuclease signature motif containing protein n=1 Tax=Streptomyces sp. Ru87 TaxID=2044307 RepID=UPI000BF651BF|nr:HNH endonuclease signature motif containing protein [Streptomyces sp. Ru87]PGH49938.1 hypothetical protein CRI70_14825 [Streptomyces sp. Ru87]
MDARTGKPYRSGNRKVPKGRRTRFATLSRAYLRQHPLCESPWCADQPEPLRPASTEVHHIDSLGLAGPRWNLPSNWLAVCHRCHSRYTAQDYGFGAR